MPRRRIGRPGVIGTMARTAVVAGTASATVGAMNRRQAGKAQAAAEAQAAEQAAFESQAQLAEMQAQLNEMQSQPATPPPPSAPTAGGGDLMTELKELADMKAAGILDDAEFAAAKAKLLG
jgi:Tfp pilus assembly protein FimV